MGKGGRTVYQADGQSVKLSNKIIVRSWMGDPMISDCQAHGSDFFFFFAFSLHRFYESVSKFLCFHGNMSSIMFLNCLQRISV